MDVAVGVGRAVMQHELGAAGRGLAQFAVEADLVPALEDFGSRCGNPARIGNSVCGK